MERRGTVVGVVALLLLAGCSTPLTDGIVTLAPAEGGDTGSVPTGPSTQDPVERTRTPYAGPSADVRVSGDLPVDAGAVFARMRRLLDEDTEPPTVEVVEQSSSGDTLGEYQSDLFEKAMGIGPPQPVAESDLEVGGLTMPSGRVYLIPRAGRPREIERTLAHEFAHTVQFSQDARREISTGIPFERRDTADGEYTERSVLEGSAVYAASEYGERYLPQLSTELVQVRRLYANASAGTKLYWGAYYFGAEYVRSRVSDPAELTRVYESPPATTEQLLHGTDDEPATLRVYAADGESPWFVEERDSRGELFVRVLLDSQVSNAAATRAATGWGNDQVLTFDGGTGVSFVWVTRWDDRTNASEFADTADRFLDSHATPDGGHWDNDLSTYDLRRVDDRTVVLLAGNDRFVTDTLVRGDPDRVYVEPPAD